MLKFTRNDVLIVRIENKTYIGRAVGKTLLDVQGADEELRFTSDQVLAVLGQNPPPGESVFGKKIDFIIDTKKIKGIDAPLLMHVPVSDVTIANMERSVRWFRNNKLATRFDMIAEIHARKPAKNIAGYKKIFKEDENRDQLLLACDDVWADQAMARALAFNLWEHMTSTELRGRWLTLLHKIRRVTNVVESELEDLYSSYIEMEKPDIRSLSTYIDSDTDIGAQIVKTILSHFKIVHGMSPADIDTLCCTSHEELGKLWPVWTAFCEQRPEFPPLALKSAAELFVYSFTALCVGSELPSSVITAVNVSIKEMGGLQQAKYANVASIEGKRKSKANAVRSKLKRRQA